MSGGRIPLNKASGFLSICSISGSRIIVGIVAECLQRQISGVHHQVEMDNIIANMKHELLLCDDVAG